MKRGWTIAVVLSVLGGGAARATPVDWGQTLRSDAQAMRDILAADHPGAVDPQNPAFAVTLEDGLRAAQAQALHTDSAGGWYWAMKAYAARFDDAHLQIVPADTAPSLPTQWAGFLTAYTKGALTVAYVDHATKDVPPLGARLFGCDGVSAGTLAAARVGFYVGQWALEAQRTKYGAWLVEDRGNPWLAPLRICTFSVAGHRKVYRLKWQAISPADLTAAEARAMPKRRTEFAYRQIDDGTWWLSFPDFSGNPQGAEFKTLTAAMDRMRADQAVLRGARRIILDVRGNGGGSSAWGDAIAGVIWDETWRTAHPVPRPTAVDWRVSKGNIAALQGYLDSYRASGNDAAGLQEEVAGMTAAYQAHETWWHRPLDDAPAAPAGGGVAPKVKVFVLTDEWCFSACLDAVDEWKANGAIQVGRSTGADTLYIENKLVPLPSGQAQLAVSMKVYRGRARGNNQPQLPDHVWDGNMDDDAAILAWVRDM